MARQLRFEYHGAWYHVMNRGANQKFIFYTDEHRKLFLSLLKEIVDLFSIEIHSYCLMGNHYHLLIHTPFPNLSKAMRHLNGIYTQKFNQLEKRDGGLFRGRYKAIVIQNELYLLQVSRYIHLNPTEAKLCELPEEYVWSSYQTYINNVKNTITHTSVILEEIGGLENYIDFIREGLDIEIKKFYNNSVIPLILGSQEFKINVLKKTTVENIQSSPADIKRILQIPEVTKIIEIVARYYNTDTENVIKNVRGQKNVYRLTAIYLSSIIGQQSHAKIAKYFNTSSDAIRGVLRNYGNHFALDKNIKDIIAILADCRI